ncbi:MAG: phosphoribosylamine--glycine ligase [Bacteroidota bacterium]|nr:phosphoribosylamine--glycine ligase [Bacteroidota bacterium]
MNLLLLGSGGREHALAWKLSESPLLNRLYIAPGNAGTAAVGTNVPIGATDFDALKTFSLDHGIDMIVVGPEAPLVEGVYDFFHGDEETRHIRVIGPSKEGAMLEGSKDFAKNFMVRHQIPTARFLTVSSETIEEGYAFIDSLPSPYVLKADGLAAGKGVLIVDDADNAKRQLGEMLDGQFGEASRRVVIEEFLSGVECSVFVLTDGKSYKILPVAKDYKRIGEGDSGLNTGGMGAVSPVPFADADFMEKVRTRIVEPTVNGLREEGIPYKGFIFLGLIKVGEDPKVIEYNARMGDPETQAVIPLVQSDLLDLMVGVATETLGERSLVIDSRHAVAVVMASGGYPGSYETGKPIDGLGEVSESLVFHAGTKEADDGVVTSGGRVLAVTSLGATMNEALEASYRSIEKIRFEKRYFRRDIGTDLKAYGPSKEGNMGISRRK